MPRKPFSMPFWSHMTALGTEVPEHEASAMCLQGGWRDIWKEKRKTRNRKRYKIDKRSKKRTIEG